MTEPLLAVRGLSKRFPAGWDRRGRPVSWLWAVDYVDLDVFRGETIAIVGESGSGKTTLAQLMFRLQRADSGSVRLGRTDVFAASGEELLGVRRRMQLLFQHPGGSLDPRRSVSATLEEALTTSRLPPAERRLRAGHAIELVGLPRSALARLPGELSGGERQRVALARCLIGRPELVVLDEPVSALDPSVQARILNLLVELKDEIGLSYVIISHDLSVVRQIADRVAVMYLGQLVEHAPAATLFDDPRHPYTEALVSSVPALEGQGRGPRVRLQGEPGTAVDPGDSCRFAPRCAYALERCLGQTPGPRPDARDPTRSFACFNPRSATGAAASFPAESQPARSPRPSAGEGRRRQQPLAPFVMRRSARALLTLVASSLVIFAAIAAPPGGAFLADGGSSGDGTASFVTRYADFVKGLLSGNLGTSVVSGAPIGHILATAGRNTLKLDGAALLLVYLTAIPLGVVAARYRGRLADRGVRTVALLAMGIPNFFLAALLIQYVALRLRWLPEAGPGGLTHLVLPAIALAAEAVATNLRLLRSTLVEELAKPYIRSLQARGLRSGRVLWVHALRNALPPVVAYAASVVPLVLGYTIVIELIFRFEGLGYELVESIIEHDYLLAQTIAFLFASAVVLWSLAADVAQRWLAPQLVERTVAGR